MDENKKNDICGDSAKESRTAYENNSYDSLYDPDLRKFFFVLGLCLWACLLFFCLRSGITTSIRRGRLDLYSFVQPIRYVWFDSILRRYVLLYILSIALAAYPIIHISYIRKTRKEKSRQSTVDNTELSAEENEIQAPPETKRRFGFGKLLFISAIVFIVYAVFVLPIMTDTSSLSELIQYYIEDGFILSMIVISVAYIVIYSVVVFLLPNVFGIRLRRYTLWYSIFMLSFALYLIIPYAGFFRFGFSIMGSRREVYYGFTAMLSVIILYCVAAPVYPFLIVAQIVFYKVSSHHDKLSDLQRTATKRVIQLLLLISFLIGVLSIFGINGSLLE